MKILREVEHVLCIDAARSCCALLPFFVRCVSSFKLNFVSFHPKHVESSRSKFSGVNAPSFVVRCVSHEYVVVYPHLAHVYVVAYPHLAVRVA